MFSYLTATVKVRFTSISQNTGGFIGVVLSRRLFPNASQPDPTCRARWNGAALGLPESSETVKRSRLHQKPQKKEAQANDSLFL